MARWYEIPASARTPEQERLCQRAYYKTFYEAAEGQYVHLDLRRKVNDRRGKITDADDALVQVILDEFLLDIAETAGVVDYERLMRAEAAIARDFAPPRQQQESDPAVLDPGPT